MIAAMTSRMLVVAFASLVTAAPAFAQAPGEWEPTQAPGETPQVAPDPGPSCAQIDPLRHRIAVGLSIGSFAYGTNDESGRVNDEAEFSGAELAIRYRASRRWELVLNF